MKIVLVALNARNNHKSPSVWYLHEYCKRHGVMVEVLEFNINQSKDAVESAIINAKPEILGFSCYIWNIEFIKAIAKKVKVATNSKIILGGPEVWFDDLSDYQFADYIVRGAGEQAFYRLVDIAANNPQNQVIEGDCQLLDCAFLSEQYFNSLKTSQLPIKNQLIYYESTRGCRYECAYCLSQHCKRLEYLPIERVKSDILLLLQNGATTIKFVDRTFNALKARCKEILQFISELDTQATFHFEVAADLFDEQMLDIVQGIKAGRVQFEIGVQSTDAKVLNAVNRKTDTALVLRNIERLAANNNCRIHVDLIAGLPLETLDGVLNSLDECIKAKPHIIQLGFLKLLKGTALREDKNFVFDPIAPYEVRQTAWISLSELKFLKRIEALIDRFYNSMMFKNTLDFAFSRYANPSQFFVDLVGYIDKNKIDNDFFKVMPKAYGLLHDFLGGAATHYIKLDCLSYHIRGSLPSSIKPSRQKSVERELRQNGKTGCFRIEYFDFDKTTRLFEYDFRHPVTRSFTVKTS